MRKFTVIIFFLTTALSVAAQNFEGVIEMDSYTREKQENASTKWFLKNGNHRMEMAGVSGEMPYALVLLMPKGGLEVLLLMEIEGKSAVFPSQDAVPVDPISPGAVVKKTGETRNIAGFNSFLVKIESGEEAADVWVTDESKLKNEDFPAIIRGKGAVGALKANGISGVPLEMVNRDEAGEITYSFQIKSITPQSLSDDLFAVPADAENGEELMKKSIVIE